MKTLFFNSKPYDREFFDDANKKFKQHIHYIRPRLSKETCSLAAGYDAVCAFVNDELDRKVIEGLHKLGIKLIVLRCAGFNNVDLKAALDNEITVARVPAYSPHGVAEHAVALILALNRKIYRAHNRIHEGNFSLNSLLGFELYGKTVGVIGTGKIGVSFANIMLGFGCKILAYDPYVNKELAAKKNVSYVSLNELYKQSHIISLHLPLTPESFHLIDVGSIKKMRKGVMLINTSRGGLINTKAVVHGLKSGVIGYLGLDVYEEEAHFFFEDFSGKIIQDDTLARLMTFPNVVMTGHQAFFTETALQNIAETTLENIRDFERGKIKPECQVTEAFIQ